MSSLKGTIVTWLGHATVQITTAKGTSILIDPFIRNNPKFPKGYELPEKVDLILASHGHGDHIDDLIAVAGKYGSTVVGMPELIGWAQSRDIKNGMQMNLGGTWRYKDVAISMVEARHSSGIDDNGKIIYAGDAAGYVIAVNDGPVLYHAGDTAVFSDMQLIRELYKPQLALLPIGGHYTMDPKAAAVAVKFLGVKTVLPIHYGTFPVLTGTPEQLKHFLQGSGVEVKAISPGESIR